MNPRPERTIARLTEGGKGSAPSSRPERDRDPYVDIKEYLRTKDTILVPMASTEQHGPHLPLYTDTITAVEVSERISEAIGVLHTPPLWAGYSPQQHDGGGPGARAAVTLRASTLLNLMNVAR